MRLNLIRSLHLLADERLVSDESGNNGADDADRLGNVISPARRSALDILKSQRADQLLTPTQQSLLGVIVDDMDTLDPPRLGGGQSVFASERGETILRLRTNSLRLLRTLCETPLLFAVREKNIAEVRSLLASDCDPDEADIESVSPLCHACEMQSLDIVRLLVDAGADVNHETLFGHRPLDFARWYGSSGNGVTDAIVALLIERGAEDINPD